jgi:hypothetical protein
MRGNWAVKTFPCRDQIFTPCEPLPARARAVELYLVEPFLAFRQFVHEPRVHRLDEMDLSIWQGIQVFQIHSGKLRNLHRSRGGGWRFYFFFLFLSSNSNRFFSFCFSMRELL